MYVSLVLLQSDGPNTPNRVFTGVGGGGVQFEWNITRVVQVFHKRGYVPFIVKCFFFRSTDKETSEGALLRHVSTHARIVHR